MQKPNASLPLPANLADLPLARMLEAGVSDNALMKALSHPRVPTGLYLIHPSHATMLGDALAFEANTRMRGKETGERFGYRVDGGSAIIPVMGTLISRGNFVGPMMGVTSYEGLRAEVRRAANDKKVDKIVLAIDSPGGMVSGIDSVCQEIMSAKEKKPVIAHVEGMAASAAYWIASQADSIVATPMSEIGSIGVLALHADVSQAMSQMGVKMTAVYSGAHKIDGNPFEPLPPTVRYEMQKDVDALREKFCTTVAAGRKKKCSFEDAMATEAQMFSVDEALSKGLADYTGSLDAVIGAPQGFFTGGRAFASVIEEPAMDLSKAVAADAAQGAVSASAAAPVIDVSPTPAPIASAPAVDEKKRIAAIIGSDAAKGREALAQKLAFETDMTAEQALIILEAAPVAAAPTPSAPSVADRAASMPSTAGVSKVEAPRDPAADNHGWDAIVDKMNASARRH